VSQGWAGAVGDASRDEAGVDGPGDGVIHVHGGDDRGADDALDVSPVEGSACLMDADDAGGPAQQRGGSPQRQVAVAGDQDLLVGPSK